MESRYKRDYKDFFAPTLQIQAEAAELGIDIKTELNKIKDKHSENWATPTSRDYKENLSHYLNRMDSRYRRGHKDFFAPALHPQAEAAELGIDIKDELNKIKDKHSENWATPTSRDYKGKHHVHEEIVKDKKN